MCVHSFTKSDTKIVKVSQSFGLLKNEDLRNSSGVRRKWFYKHASCGTTAWNKRTNLNGAIITVIIDDILLANVFYQIDLIGMTLRNATIEAASKHSYQLTSWTAVRARDVRICSWRQISVKQVNEGRPIRFINHVVPHDTRVKFRFSMSKQGYGSL